MKKLLYLVTLLFASLSIYSQNKFIEIEVNDTILLKPTSFEVAISIKEESPYGGIYNDDEDTETSQLKADSFKKNKSTEIEKFLKSKNYKFSSGNSGDSFMGISMKNDNQGFIVSISSVVELKKLETDIKSIDKIETNIVKTTYEDGTKYDDLLYKKILVKAKTKANIITSNSSLILGSIFEIRDNLVTVSSNPMEDYTKLMAEMMSKMQNKSGLNPEKKEYKKSYIFKFEVK